MSRISLVSGIFVAILALCLITRPVVVEAHGIVPVDSVAVTHKTIYDAAKTIEVGGKGKHFTVQAGSKVIITSGRSVRLLPGTKIKMGGLLTVKVTNVRKTRYCNKSNNSTPVVKQIPKTDIVSPEFALAFHAFPIPGSETILMALNGSVCVLPVRVRLSNEPVQLIKEKKISFQYFHDLPNSLKQGALQKLSLRWGERPESIKVLRT